MKFLCFHGAIGNVDNISIQLAPLEKEMSMDSSAEFHYIMGPVPVIPPAGFAEYFGVGPHFRWLEDNGVAEESMISRVRKAPHGQSPEDAMRTLGEGWDGRWNNHQQVMDYLYDILEKNPDIAGVIGYSEGATMAASLIMDEAKKAQETGRVQDVVLADESDLILDVPTLHVVGADDPYRYGALALFNVCDPDSAALFDTGGGHTIPRSGKVIKEL
ncbi:hypothetical protein N7499_005893 [Penicillium canescens]|nr:hypothetical protein N7499_005893 [Penicillium canescens]